MHKSVKSVRKKYIFSSKLGLLSTHKSVKIILKLICPDLKKKASLFFFRFFWGGGVFYKKKFTLFQAAGCTRWKPGLSWSLLFGDSHTQHWGWWFISIFILKYFWFVYFSPRIQLCCELLIQSPVVPGHTAYWHLFTSS